MLMTDVSRFSLVVSAMAVSILLYSPMASATVIASQSFENPTLNTPGIMYGPDEDSYNTNETGPVVIPNFAFNGFSGIISNGSLGVFANAPDGNQAAFLQSYQGVGSEIQWSLSGLNPGETYLLSFMAAGSLIVPAQSFDVSAFGVAQLLGVTPSSTYQLYTLKFTPTLSSGAIDFTTSALCANCASAIDDLSVSTVPEPGTLALLGVGLVGLGALRRRRNARKAA